MLLRIDKALLLTLVREVSACTGPQLIQMLLTGQNLKNKWLLSGVLSPKQASISPLQCSEDIKGKGPEKSQSQRMGRRAGNRVFSQAIAAAPMNPSQL